MKVTIISQNLQGLNDRIKVGVVRNYFQALIPTTDILCFQEHKLRCSRLIALKDAIWPWVAFYAEEATLDYRHVLKEEGAGKGGFYMWVAPSIQYLALDYRHSWCGCAQRVRLRGTLGSNINIVNIYASTNSAKMIVLWGELSNVLPRDCQTTLLGDFNFVERREDRSSQCGKLISVGERFIFAQLTALLGIEDRFPSSGPTKCSCDNGRRDGMRILAQLDRFYTFQPATSGVVLIKEYLSKAAVFTQIISRFGTSCS
jgi:exonuclease III